MLCQPYTSANLQFRELVVQIIAWPRPCHCQDNGPKSTRPDDRCPLCVPKTKSERIDDEARPRWRAKLWRRIAEPDERPARLYPTTDAF